MLVQSTTSLAEGEFLSANDSPPLDERVTALGGAPMTYSAPSSRLNVHLRQVALDLTRRNPAL